MFKKFFQSSIFNLLLFCLTLVSTSLAGADWMSLPSNSLWGHLQNGLWYSLPFLGILTFHEFGHYFTARWYKLNVTLPYYIPFYLPFMPGIGTMGAFIKIKSPMNTLKTVFDVGIAGPLAGFMVAMMVIWYGFSHLPTHEDIFTIHPEYRKYGENFEQHVYTYTFMREQDSIACVKNGIPFIPQNEYQLIGTGSNLLYSIMTYFFEDATHWIPNPYELYHFPFLFAGFLALFFTALNLLPIGQLDGGHVLYTLIGHRRYQQVVPIIFAIFVYLGTLDFLNASFDLKPMLSLDDLLVFAPFYILFLTIVFASLSPSFTVKLYYAVIIFALQFFTLYFFPQFKGFYGWWVFAFLLGRFLGIYHPPCNDNSSIGTSRTIIGIFTLLVFILCFSPQPIFFETLTKWL
jgi:membrane-associated protease RseP (regulator of RpoE activity)